MGTGRRKPPAVMRGTSLLPRPALSRLVCALLLLIMQVQRCVTSNAPTSSPTAFSGQCIAWGLYGYGGNTNSVQDALASDVTSVISTDGSFAALTVGGAVVTWGNIAWGGNSTTVSNALASGVQSVRSTTKAFAAIKSSR